MNGRLLVLILLIPLAAQAQLQLPGIFSDNMILQRDNPVYIWGKAAPGEKVSVSFSNAAESTITAKDSCWCVKLPAQKANAHGQDLVVRAGNEKIALRNVLTGDIWLCIGQSNMEFPMRNEVNFAREKEVSDQPMLRFYNPDYPGKNIYSTLFTDSIADRLVPEKFYQGKWQTCDSITFKNMSAVAYYFGKAINERAGIPVGLINLSIGGAPLETFIGKEALKKSRQFSAKINANVLVISGTGANVTGTLGVSSNITAVGNVSGSYFIGNGSQLTGIDATAIQNGTANMPINGEANEPRAIVERIHGFHDAQPAP